MLASTLMNLEQLGIVVCRGAGLILLLAGLCALLPAILALLFGPTSDLLTMGVRVSWTRYAPPQFTFGQLCLITLRANAGHIAQIILGAGLLVFSRFVGGLLTAGLLGRAT